MKVDDNLIQLLRLYRKKPVGSVIISSSLKKINWLMMFGAIKISFGPLPAYVFAIV